MENYNGFNDYKMCIRDRALAGPAMRQMHALTDHLGKLLQRVAQSPKKKTRKA